MTLETCVSIEKEGMEMLKEYSEKYGLKEVVNDYGEHRHTSDRSIVFQNGWVASIVENNVLIHISQTENT